MGTDTGPADTADAADTTDNGNTTDHAAVDGSHTADRPGAARSRRVAAAVDRHWFWLLVATAGLALGAATVGRFVLEPFAMHPDAALFQHAGWYILEGATPYVDIWDLKPPLIYVVTTGLAAVAGGDMAVLHVLSVVLSVLTVGGGVVLVGVLTHRLTGDGVAAYAAGASLFVVPTMYAFPSLGIRPKYFAFLFGVGGLLLAVDDRPLASGAAAATAAGFWQLGAGIAPLVVAIGYQRGGRERAIRAVAGGFLVAVCVVAPFVAAGLAVPLVVETVLAPVYAVERYTVAGRLLGVVLEVGLAGVAFLALGGGGWRRGLVSDRSRYWWVAVGGGAYALQVFLEMQGAIELVFLFAFAGIGVGYVVAARDSPEHRLRVLAVIAVLVAANGYWAVGPVRPVNDEVAAAHAAAEVPDYATLPDRPADAPSMRTIYWDKRRPERCHYRYGDKQRYFAATTGGDLQRTTCGEWPFDRPPREWLLDRLQPTR